jgi:hypothetical protein
MLFLHRRAPDRPMMAAFPFASGREVHHKMFDVLPLHHSRRKPPVLEQRACLYIKLYMYAYTTHLLPFVLIRFLCFSQNTSTRIALPAKL